MEKIKFNFHGRKEAMEIIYTGGNLVSYLANQREECPLIGSEIKLVKKLGQGAFGAAFLIKIEGMGTKQYVAKVIKNEAEEEKIEETTTLEEFADEIRQFRLLDYRSIIDLNGGDPNLILEPGDVVYLPYYATICKTSREREFDRFDGKGKTIIPKGSYLCEDTQYSEFVIGVQCGLLYRKNITAHFFDIFGFATCLSPRNIREVKQYVFMEKLDGTLLGTRQIIFQPQSSSPEDLQVQEILLIQILHTVAVYQYWLNLQHNDLHPGNILFEKVTKDTVFNGQRIFDADWFHYHIYGIDLYLPYVPILIKIGDFGLSVKYSNPVIGDEKVLENGHNQHDGKGPWMPNWYAESYDALFIIKMFYEFGSPYTLRMGGFSHKLMRWILGIDKDPSLRTGETSAKYYVAGEGTRPSPHFTSGVGERATPKNILTNPDLMGDYMKKPPRGKIVTLGIVA